ncbi:MAG: Beta-ketoacyl synthase [Cyanobacteriota bacterium]|jgi:3-oxoacyl-[acyl-carrier-protein] synthase II
MNSRRVVVTGLGSITTVGYGVSEFAQALRNGVSGVSEIENFDKVGFPSNKGCEIKNFEPKDWILNLDTKTLGRSSQFATGAARLAVEDARIDLEVLSREGCGVCVGTTEGEAQANDQLYKTWHEKGPEYLNPETVRQSTADRLSISIALELNLSGEAVTISTACSAGNYAIGHAYDLISSGELDYMICGGSDSMGRNTFAGFHRLGAIAPVQCQPFDKDRQGILTGEGSGMLFLESLESAIIRGAKIYAEILGYGLNCDANHMVAPDRESIANCMRLAHKNAKISPEDVDYISAHGTGTRANDLAESSAIREVFGENSPPTSSIKSMIGHTMGAASALSAIACVIALEQDFIPPTINCRTPDQECGIDCVPNVARKAKLKVIQNNGFAFGGNNAIVILGQYQI